MEVIHKAAEKWSSPHYLLVEVGGELNTNRTTTIFLKGIYLTTPFPLSIEYLVNSAKVNPKIKQDSFHFQAKSMTESNRIDKMEDQLIDMRLAVSALLETVTQHQRNFETIQRNFETTNNRFTAIITEIRDIRVDMQEMRVDMQEMRVDMQEMRVDMQEMQSEVRGLQTENRRILDILQNRQNEGDS